ncbi:hypothetical protein WJ438_29210 [Streptomyces sp. GD-15H]|uniref:hypothetical protein n=1 Tax=Streptomyces sp. GD-15H TaxID=3129112 RepID=UPI00324E7243
MSAAEASSTAETAPAAETSFAAETSMTSPRIAAVAAAVEAGDHDAVDAFWKEVAEAGSP